MDDNKTNRIVLAEQLSSCGIEVFLAEDAGAAIRLLVEAHTQDRPCDAAILDMQMPEIDGLELARQIRAHDAIARLPLLLATSAAMDHAAGDSALAPVDRVLTKPLRKSDLLNVLASLLNSPRTPDVTASAATAVQLPRLRGHALVVEDTAVNRAVAQAMLGAIGVSCRVAEHGAAALAAATAERFDVILMDVQMPVMDGYEASRRIRSLADPGIAQTPILGITANASDGEEQQCLAAGMNAFLTKPYSMARLHATLALHLPSAASAQGELSSRSEVGIDAAPNHPQNNLDAGVLNREVLATLRILDPSGGDGLLIRVAGHFLDAEGALKARMDHALLTDNRQELSRAAHALKSSSANVGALALSRSCAALEEALRTTDGRIKHELAEAFRIEHARAVGTLRTICGRDR